MKLARIFFSILFTLCFGVVLTGCEKSTELDALTYLKPEVSYKLYKSEASSTFKTESIINATSEAMAYDTIQINTNKTWTYGLTLQTIKFDVALSEPANMDIDITVSNLENGENYNKTQDTFFYHKTVTVSQESSTVTLEINDVFIDKDATISLEIVDSCYTSFPNLKVAIGNFKMFGYHTENNY